jgi:hypothetical protein
VVGGAVVGGEVLEGEVDGGLLVGGLDTVVLERGTLVLVVLLVLVVGDTA